MVRPIGLYSSAQPIATNAFYGSFPLLTRVNCLAIPIILLVVGGVFYYVATRFFEGRNDKNGKAPNKTYASLEEGQVKEPRPGDNAESSSGSQEPIPTKQPEAQEGKKEETTSSTTTPIHSMDAKKDQVKEPRPGDNAESSSGSQGQVPIKQPEAQEKRTEGTTSSTTTPRLTAPIEKTKLELKKFSNGFSLSDNASLFKKLMEKIIEDNKLRFRHRYNDKFVEVAIPILQGLSTHASDILTQLEKLIQLYKLNAKEVEELLRDSNGCHVMLILTNLSTAYHAIRQEARVEKKEVFMRDTARPPSDSKVSPLSSSSKIIQGIIDHVFLLHPSSSFNGSKHSKRFYDPKTNWYQLRELYNKPLEILKRILPPDHDFLTSYHYSQDHKGTPYVGPDTIRT